MINDYFVCDNVTEFTLVFYMFVLFFAVGCYHANAIFFIIVKNSDNKYIVYAIYCIKGVFKYLPLTLNCLLERYAPILS